jgi:hypothetical protein
LATACFGFAMGANFGSRDHKTRHIEWEAIYQPNDLL